jgi:hypothetical protein
MDLPRIYYYIEESYGIRLELSDKMRISLVLREHNPETVGDRSHIILNTLVDFGYNNRITEKSREDREKWLKRFAEYVYQGYKTK